MKFQSYAYVVRPHSRVACYEPSVERGKQSQSEMGKGEGGVLNDRGEVLVR